MQITVGKVLLLMPSGFEHEAEYQIEFDPEFEALLEGERRKQEEVAKAIKPLPSSGFAGLLKRKQFIFGINKRERDRLGAESPAFTPGRLGGAPALAPPSEGTPGRTGFLSLSFPSGKPVLD